MDLGDLIPGWNDFVPSRDEFDSLSSDFLIGVIIIGIALFLLTLLLIILYCWLYKVEQKIKQIRCNPQTDFTIRRAHINNDGKNSITGPGQIPQNPLSRSNNFNAVVHDLKRTSNAQPNALRYPNYTGENNNFAF